MVGALSAYSLNNDAGGPSCLQNQIFCFFDGGGLSMSQESCSMKYHSDVGRSNVFMKRHVPLCFIPWLVPLWPLAAFGFCWRLLAAAGSRGIEWMS